MFAGQARYYKTECLLNKQDKIRQIFAGQTRQDRMFAGQTIQGKTECLLEITRQDKTECLLDK